MNSGKQEKYEVVFSSFHHTVPVKIHSMATHGLDCIPIEVEADITRGLPKFFIVGLGDAAVQEAKERTRSAIKNSGLTFPIGHITVNLAPADVRKVGPSFDLPIALGLLLASRQIEIPESVLQKSMMIGELALDGKLRSVSGILPICIAAKRRGFSAVFVPQENALEASLVEDIEVYGVDCFEELIAHFSGERIISSRQGTSLDDFSAEHSFLQDFSAIRGQESCKRALEIAAAGGHNILMNGTPGSGKTLMAKALQSILPPLSKAEALEVTQIYSVANLLPAGTPLMTSRPFRTVHHTASSVSLVGGGKVPRPGEISLAHHGVLFLDELAEFPAQSLEVLRQPLEDRCIAISRASGNAVFPANFLLVAAMNPTRSGQPLATEVNEVSLEPAYRKKLSGPLLDRIDLYTNVTPVKFEKLTAKEEGEPSVVIQDRVRAARQRQLQRFQKRNIYANAQMKTEDIKKFCQIDATAENILKQAMRQFGLSARGFHRVLKVARTIADLAASENIVTAHIAEALQYRARIPS